MITNDFALIYGIMLGDGCLSKTGKGYFISITCDYFSDKPLFTIIQPKLENIRGKSIRVKNRIKYGKIEINFCDKNLFFKFKNYGFPVGKKGINLSISQVMINHINPIIQGYFATDGCLVLTNNNGTFIQE